MDRISLLVTVKAYPAISQKYGEVVCVAGVRMDTPAPEWVRLFPVPFRDLPYEDRFKKYRRVSLEATRHSGDPRPESYRPNVESLEVGEFLDSKKAWEKRKPFVEPLIVESMCEVYRLQETSGMSLAAFRPDVVDDLEVERKEEELERAAMAAQPSLFFQSKEALEQIPFRWRYRYRCATEGCRGHAQSIIDWELAQSYRKWRELYDQSTLLEKIRERFLEKMCGPDVDTVFFVGNQHLQPKGFLVLGVFWPKRSG